MKVKVIGGAPSVAVPGLGIVTTNEWFEVTDEQATRFQRLTGKTLEESTSKNFQVKKETKVRTKKEAD
jgi:hypothetical protein